VTPDAPDKPDTPDTPDAPRATSEQPPRATSEPPPRATSEPPVATIPPGRRSAPIAIPMPPILPTPAEAALNAATIVSEMVDIDSESGAVIAAAAAAGAAIEAAVVARKLADAARVAEAGAAMADAAQEANEQRAEDAKVVVATAGPQSTPVLVDLHAASSDPVTTVKLSRDRILQALADEESPEGGPRHPRARTEPGANRDSAPSLQRARSEPGVQRARSEPGIPRARSEPGLPPPVGESKPDEPIAETEEPEDFDPVAIAAAAIARLRTRAKTDLGHLRLQYQRHDGFVLLIALVLIIIAGRVHAHLVTPPTETFDSHGLTFEHSTAWLAPEVTPMPSPRIVRDAFGGSPAVAPSLYHVELTSTLDAAAKIEVMIDKQPKWSNTAMILELDRRTRWGELYKLDDSSVRSIDEHDWLRTAYRYAHVPDKGDTPRVDSAIEYATIDHNEQIYVVTLFGTPAELERMEDVIAPSLRVPSIGRSIVSQASRLDQRQYPDPVGRAFDSTVMVVVADIVDGRLKARGGGSGVIVGGDGSVLTNYHVIVRQDDRARDDTPHDPKDDKLHDVFLIARYSTLDRAPQLQCAGKPSRSKLQPAVDLALIKCDLDLDGRSWTPASGGGVWATLAEVRASDIKMGERLWVLGYPDVGGGGLTLFDGAVEGWTGPDGTSGRDFIKTNASISSGSSGGPVVDDQGKLVGIASAFRARVGLVRPLQSASRILAYAAGGWTPLEGHNEVELTPTAVEAATEGIRIYTTVVDDATGAPIRDALVMVLKPGVNTSSIDLNRLNDQAIAWGKTNEQGEVRLKQLVPIGTYTVMVEADRYEALIGDSELHLDGNTPASFDPWGKIGLRSR
jgi:S1-C subfamily serine protease